MNQLVPQAFSHGLDFETAKDRSNPRSLVNILPSVASQALMAIPEELFDLDVEELKTKAKADSTLDLLRTAWWLEYNRAQKTKTTFILANVYSGLVQHKKFIRDFIGNSFKLLYMMTPPVDYTVQTHHILSLSLDQEMKILQMPTMKAVYNKSGEMIGEEVDTKLLAVQQKIAESMRNRIMGMPVNRTMQINQNFNSNAPFGESMTKAFDEMDENELQAFIDQKKKEKGLDPAQGDTIDVTKKQES